MFETEKGVFLCHSICVVHFCFDVINYSEYSVLEYLGLPVEEYTFELTEIYVTHDVKCFSCPLVFSYGVLRVPFTVYHTLVRWFFLYRLTTSRLLHRLPEVIAIHNSHRYIRQYNHNRAW
jgi:hypothetical protein